MDNTENTPTEQPKPEITPIQALNNLYMASKMAPLTANDHEILLASANVLKGIIEKSSAPKTPSTS